MAEKLLIIYPYFGTPNGSWSTRVYELSRRWVNMGMEVEVITAPYEKSDITAKQFISKKRVEGINLTIINSADDNRLPFIMRSFRSIVFAICSCFFVLFRKYDVVLASSGPITVGIPLIIAKVLRGKKAIFEVRDLWPDGAIEMGKLQSRVLIYTAKKFEKACYYFSDKIVTASPGMTNHIQRRYPESSVLTFPNASDIELFQRPQELPQQYNSVWNNYRKIIYAGSLGEMDECETAIRAMKHFINKPLLMFIIGEGTEKGSLMRLKEDLGLTNVLFLGLVKKTEVIKWFKVADASLVGFQNYPVLATCSPNKMFDSFAAGVPVIQNTSGWIRDLLIKHGGGFTVRYGSVENYIEVFNRLIGQDSFRAIHGKEALRLAETMFDRDTIAREYYKVLQS